MGTELMNCRMRATSIMSESASFADDDTVVDSNSNLQEVELKKPRFIEPLVTEEVTYSPVVSKDEKYQRKSKQMVLFCVGLFLLVLFGLAMVGALIYAMNAGESNKTFRTEAFLSEIETVENEKKVLISDKMKGEVREGNDFIKQTLLDGITSAGKHIGCLVLNCDTGTSK